MEEPPAPEQCPSLLKQREEKACHLQSGFSQLWTVVLLTKGE